MGSVARFIEFCFFFILNPTNLVSVTHLLIVNLLRHHQLSQTSSSILVEIQPNNNNDPPQISNRPGDGSNPLPRSNTSRFPTSLNIRPHRPIQQHNSPQRCRRPKNSNNLPTPNRHNHPPKRHLLRNPHDRHRHPHQHPPSNQHPPPLDANRPHPLLQLNNHLRARNLLPTDRLLPRKPHKHRPICPLFRPQPSCASTTQPSVYPDLGRYHGNYHAGIEFPAAIRQW